jgi:YVTN family beta-propeller protein
MYVDNETGKTLSAIDPQSLTVIRTYNLGFTPAMAQTAQSGELWVTDTDNGKVVFFAAASDSKIGELASGAGAHAISFASDGATAYVTNQTAGTLSIIDVATKTVRKTLTVGAKPNGVLFRPRS